MPRPLDARHRRAPRLGFTLIELLVVVTIIGVLAAIAVGRYAQQKQKTLVATMRSDLRNLATAQESYASEHQGLYADGLDQLAPGFRPSSSVTIALEARTSSGWSATSSSGGTEVICRLAVGADQLNDGTVICQ